MKIFCLESGSKGNCYLIKHQNKYLMIDCGGTKKYIYDHLNHLSINLNDICMMVITHGHSDHIKAIGGFDDIPKRATFECKEAENLEVINTDEEFSIEGFKIKALPLSHDFPKTVGYRITCNDESLVLCCDTGYISNKVKPLIMNATYYIFESNHDPTMLMNTNRPSYLKQRILGAEGHLCNEDSSNVLSEVIGNKTKAIYLAHVSEEANTYDLPLEVLIETFDKKKIDYQNLDLHVLRQFELFIGGNLDD